MANFIGRVPPSNTEFGIAYKGTLYRNIQRRASWSVAWGENYDGRFDSFSGWGSNFGFDYDKTKGGYKIGINDKLGVYVDTDDIIGMRGNDVWHEVTNRKTNFTGAKIASSYSDIFYNRILIEPVFVDFGNILSTQSIKIEIFNAYLENKILQTLLKSGFDEGTTYTDIITPNTFLPLENRVTYLTASTMGEPQLDATLVFDWEGSIPSITIKAVGSRIVLFPVFFDSDVKEELLWATDVLNSYDGTEQRVRIRNQPRQRLNVRGYLNYDDRTRLDNLIWGWRKRVWAIPMWIEARVGSTVTKDSAVINVDTRYADFRIGGLAILFESAAKFDVFQIIALTTTTLTANRGIAKTFVNPIVMPVRSARMVSDPVRKTSGNTGDISALFEVTDNIAFAGSATAIQYNGLDTFFDEQLATGGDIHVEDNYEHRVDVIDTITGIVQTVSPWTYTRVNRTFEMIFEGPQAVWNLRQWLHRRSGRLVPFYGSNSEDAFRILSAGTIVESFSAFNNDYANQASARNNIAVYLKNGTMSIHKIVAATTSADGTNVTVRFQPDLNQQVVNIKSIQLMTKKRLSSDNITLEWKADHKAFVKIPTTELKP